MTRKIQQLRRTLVIVCEDTVVTPVYLDKIRAELAGRGTWESILIYPFPPSDNTTVKNTDPNKSTRPIRQFNPQVGGTNSEIEEEYKAVPTRYVREAQLRMLETGSNEGWAVYDADGHPMQAEAYALSHTIPTISIAFSSIAFEHWILLHFIRDNTAYTKSAYVPVHKFIAGYTNTSKSQINIFKFMRPYLEVALENTAWLRKMNSTNTSPFYEINPYVDMDLLIRCMYEIDTEIIWKNLAEPFFIRHIQFIVTLKDLECRLIVINNSQISILSRNIDLYTLDADRRKQICEVPHVMVAPGVSWEFAFHIVSPGLLNITFENYKAVIAV